MAEARAHGFTFWEGTDLRLLARPVGLSNNVLDSSDFSSATLSIYDLTSDTPTTDLYSGSDPSSLEASLQTGDEWTADDTGYTFDFTLSDSDWGSVGGHTYRIEVKITTTSDGVVPIVFEGICKALTS